MDEPITRLFAEGYFGAITQEACLWGLISPPHPQSPEPGRASRLTQQAYELNYNTIRITFKERMKRRLIASRRNGKISQYKDTPWEIVTPIYNTSQR